MKILSCVLLPVFILLVAGCSTRPSENAFQDALARSLPHDASLQPADASATFTNELTAEGTNWTVKVQWNIGELTRYVTWQDDGDGFSLGIPLRTRPTPFTYSFDGVTMTRYGPYQPACVHHRSGDYWHVQMSHEQADFPSEVDLTKMLERHFSGQPHARPALSPDGIMVTLRGPAYSGTTSLDVEIWILTVNGSKPNLSVLSPFLQGKITNEPNKRLQAIGAKARLQPDP